MTYTKADAPRQAVKLAKVVANSHASYRLAGHPALTRRLGCTGRTVSSSYHQYGQTIRAFSTTPVSQLRDFFPAKDTPHIKTTPAAWPHPGFTLEELQQVTPSHRQPRGFGDWAAWKIVRFARYWMDKATGMDRQQQVDKKNPTTAVKAEKPLTEAQWVQFPQLTMAIGC